MDHHIKLYLVLLTIITIVSVVFRKSAVPTSLIMVIVGMLLSFVPNMPGVSINPDIILDGILPLLLYTATYSSSLREIKSNARSIAHLSIGHVIFITVLVACTIHYMIPEFGWPLAFILGSVISPPDDVAILSIAEKVHMPARIMTVLRGEALLNDATALIIFKFALAALITHEFNPVMSAITFVAIVCIETLYGILLGIILGEIRLRVSEPILQVLISILTPFLAYLPAEYVFGSGVIATVVTGIYIGQVYWGRFSADVRLSARSVWTTLEFTLQCILFLLVGLNMSEILRSISSIPPSHLAWYSSAIIFMIIVGRFAWVYAAVYLPGLLFPAIKKHEYTPPWQSPFIVSWSGMRGGISLAAALAVPTLPMVNDIYPKDLLVFLVFTAIVATLLIQGLSLPWIIKLLGVQKQTLREKIDEHNAEIAARHEMSKAVLEWLRSNEESIKRDTHMAEEIKLQIKVYESITHHLERQLHHIETVTSPFKIIKMDEMTLILSDIIAIERMQLEKCWNDHMISHSIKSKLEKQLDLRAKHIEELTPSL